MWEDCACLERVAVVPLLAILRRHQRPYHQRAVSFPQRARLSLHGPFRGVLRISPAKYVPTDPNSGSLTYTVENTFFLFVQY
jgi:hypothetical protein